MIGAPSGLPRRSQAARKFPTFAGLIAVVVGILTQTTDKVAVHPPHVTAAIGHPTAHRSLR